MSPAASDMRDSPSNDVYQSLNGQQQVGGRVDALLHGVLPELIVNSSGRRRSLSRGANFSSGCARKRERRPTSSFSSRQSRCACPGSPFRLASRRPASRESFRLFSAAIFRRSRCHRAIPDGSRRQLRTHGSIGPRTGGRATGPRQNPRQDRWRQTRGARERGTSSRSRQSLEDKRSAESGATRQEPTPRNRGCASHRRRGRTDGVRAAVSSRREAPRTAGDAAERRRHGVLGRGAKDPPPGLDSRRPARDQCGFASEPAPGPLWAAWMRHVRATELAAVVRHPGSPGITHDGFSRHRRCHRATGGARHRW